MCLICKYFEKHPFFKHRLESCAPKNLSKCWRNRLLAPSWRKVMADLLNYWKYVEKYIQKKRIYGIISAVHPWFSYDSPRFADHCSSFAYDSEGFLHICVFTLIQLCLPRFDQVKHFEWVKTSAWFITCFKVCPG